MTNKNKKMSSEREGYDLHFDRAPPCRLHKPIRYRELFPLPLEGRTHTKIEHLKGRVLAQSLQQLVAADVGDEVAVPFGGREREREGVREGV